MELSQTLLRTWYAPRKTWLARWLLPLSLVFGQAVAIRASLYRCGLIRSFTLPVPVIVVGNITVGGTGKTPFVIALTQALSERGFRPGVISRGYGGRIGGKASARGDVVCVDADSDVREVGDEAALIARAGVPIAVGRDRVAAGRALLAAHPDIDVLVSDDGLQHYRLARALEIALLDGDRQLGNRLLLPAGPLREPPQRLARVNAVVLTSVDEENGQALVFRDGFGVPVFRQMLKAGAFRSVVKSDERREFGFFMKEEGVHAVAGIGHPERFFSTLQRLGIRAVTRAFADHHRFSAADLALPAARWILMTEKDAVKCAAIADERCWYLPIVGSIAPPLLRLIEETLRAGKSPQRENL
ncbi:MAG: tetraacyldisaccharide 4'-kinase [Burkholderiales bacterium]|jgi:tetraacyldisaccharide 4'-kinase|nr:tetraacyldisaccharide 4'-kinase [Burkholderiales bacterium]